MDGVASTRQSTANTTSNAIILNDPLTALFAPIHRPLTIFQIDKSTLTKSVSTFGVDEVLNLRDALFSLVRRSRSDTGKSYTLWTVC